MQRLLVVGPMVGANPGRVTTQGEVLADLLADSGYDVLTVSGASNRYVRLVDIVATTLRRGRSGSVMLLQTYGGPSFVVEDAASMLARLLGCHLVMHLHGGAMPEFFRRFPRWSRRVLKRAHVIVAPSEFLAQAVVPYGQCARVIPNVLRCENYPFQLRSRVAPRLIWMRSYHPIYNPLMALRVLQRVRVERPDATLVMGGQDNGMMSEVRAEAERMGLGAAVRVLGFMDHDSKLREMGRGAADIFLNTNHIDNTPVAVIEAAAMGLPVVATRVGGLPFLVRNEETALLVDDNDDEAMAGAVLRLVAQPELAERLSVNGRRLAESSSWSRVHDAWVDVFRGLAGDALLPGSEAGG